MWKGHLLVFKTFGIKILKQYKMQETEDIKQSISNREEHEKCISKLIILHRMLNRRTIPVGC